jgi:hypothetical protein
MGLVGLMKVLAIEGARNDIRVQRHLSNRSTRSSSTCRPGREQQPDDVVAVGAGDRERVDAAAERLIDAATN